MNILRDYYEHSIVLHLVLAMTAVRTVRAAHSILARLIYAVLVALQTSASHQSSRVLCCCREFFDVFAQHLFCAVDAPADGLAVDPQPRPFVR